MRFPLLALVLLTTTVRADDPPYLAAAKERQRTAKAFEAALTIKTEWKNVKAFRFDERRDFADTGTAKLVMDGDRYWCLVDGPTPAGTRDVFVRRRTEWAFDGQATHIRVESEHLYGERAGQLVPMTQAISTDADVERRLTLPLFDPLRWVFRGVDRGGLFSTESEHNLAFPTWVEIAATGRTEVFDGRRCVGVERTTWRDTGLMGREDPSWLDAERDYMPRRARGVTIDTTPHPVIGWRPSGWATTHSEARDTVTVDSFELRESIPADRFMVKFPVGSQVVRVSRNRHETFLVAEDGSLVPVSDKPDTRPELPQPEPPSLSRTLWVVGITVGLFVGFVVLLKRLARTRTDELSDSGNSPHLPT